MIHLLTMLALLLTFSSAFAQSEPTLTVTLKWTNPASPIPIERIRAERQIDVGAWTVVTCTNAPPATGLPTSCVDSPLPIKNPTGGFIKYAYRVIANNAVFGDSINNPVITIFSGAPLGVGSLTYTIATTVPTTPTLSDTPQETLTPKSEE